MNPGNSSQADSRARRQQGFTLLEVLIAFVLLSLTLGVILQIFSGGLRNAAAAAHYTKAAIVADSKLAMLGAEFPLVEGEMSGEDGSYVWRMTIKPDVETYELDTPTVSRYQLYSVNLVVRWRHGIREPVLQFTTYRLGSPDGF
jgi:general secretion pathway protein I